MAMKALAISVIVLVAVIMGMSAIDPAFARGPPPDPHPQEIDCEALESLVENLPARAQDAILAAAGC